MFNLAGSEKTSFAMEIAKHIGELLFDYECVIVPGLGGFITDDKPVSINEVTHSFSPPFRTVHFNTQLRANDGLLINYIAQQEHIEYNIAKQKVDIFVFQCHNSLNAGKNIIFKDIGSIYYDDDKNIVFEQDIKVNYNSGSFGLSTLVSPAIKRVTDEEKLKSVVISAIDKSKARKKPIDRKGTKEGVKQSKHRKSMFANSLIVLLAFIFLMGSGYLYLNRDAALHYFNKYSSHIPFFYSSVNDYLADNINSAPVATLSRSTASMFPFFLDKEEEITDEPNTAKEDIIETTEFTENTNVASETIEQPTITTVDNNIEEVVVEGENSNPDNAITTEAIVTNAGSEDNTNIASIPEASSTATTLSKGRFLIIAGSFSKESNANKLVNQLKTQGFDAVIADTSKSGMYRVAIMKLSNRKIAMEKLLAIRNENNPDAWLLVK